MFEKMHPAVNFIFFLGAIGITVASLNPYVLVVSWIMSLIFEITLKGLKALKQNLWVAIPVIVFTVGIQPLFSHSGITPLFYINDNAVTLESYLYGGAISLMLISVIQWCTCMAEVIDSDKYMYIFGNVTPTLSLLISMTLRFIPLLKARYNQIKEGQMGLGRKRGVSQKIKELSVLISWSLEESMETSISMEARGYGKRRRTTYSTYRFKTIDCVFLATMIVLLSTVTVAFSTGSLATWYLPQVIINVNGALGAVGIIAFVLLSAMPVALEIRERRETDVETEIR